MSLAAKRPRRRSAPALLALLLLLALGQLESGTHRLVHPLSAGSCEACALAHQPADLAATPEPVRPTACEVEAAPIGAVRSEPFVALATSRERAPPPASA